MPNLAKAKYASKCVECGTDLKPGTPIWWEGQAAWCQTHGEYPRGEPETALEGTEDLKRIADSLDALLTGISKDFELSRLDARGIYDELKGIKIVLEQIKGQGMK